MATIKEIAVRAGVSIGTVDRVIHNRGSVNEETQKKIQKVMKELDYRPNRAGQALAVRKKKYHFICLIVEDEHHPFFGTVNAAMKKKAEELEAFGVETEFINASEVLTRVGKKYRIELSKIDGLEERIRNCSGFITGAFNESHESSVETILEENKIPCVNYNSEDTQGRSLAYVGADYLEAGRIAMGLTALIGGSHARVIVLSETIAYSDGYVKRINGYCREGKLRYPNIKIVDVVDISDEDAVEKVRDSISRHEEANIIYLVNPGDYSICHTIKDMGQLDRLKIITNDLTGIVEDLMKEGVISATITQQPEEQGSKALEVLFNYVAYGIVPPEKIYTKSEIHILQNI